MVMQCLFDKAKIVPSSFNLQFCCMLDLLLMDYDYTPPLICARASLQIEILWILSILMPGEVEHE